MNANTGFEVFSFFQKNAKPIISWLEAIPKTRLSVESGILTLVLAEVKSGHPCLYCELCVFISYDCSF